MTEAGRFAKSASAPSPVVRRNATSRLAGGSYALVIALWLGLYLGQPGAPLPAAVAILSLFLVSGALLALYQDDLRFDSADQSIEHVRGLPGLNVRRSIPFSAVSQISVQVAPVLRSDHETSVVHRHWCSVNLVLGEELLRLWEAETDDTEEARLALLERGKAYASRFTRILSVPIVNKE